MTDIETGEGSVVIDSSCGIAMTPQTPQIFFKPPIEDFSQKHSQDDILLLCGKTDDEVLSLGPIFDKSHAPGEKFYCNSYLLSKYSDVIRFLSTGNFTENSDRTMELKEICPSFLQLILELAFFPAEFLEKRNQAVEYILKEKIAYLREIFEHTHRYDFPTAKYQLSLLLSLLPCPFTTNRRLLFNDEVKPDSDIDIIIMLNEYKLYHSIAKWGLEICQLTGELQLIGHLIYDPTSSQWVYNFKPAPVYPVGVKRPEPKTIKFQLNSDFLNILLSLSTMETAKKNQTSMYH